jgi:Conserved TM helix
VQLRFPKSVNVELTEKQLTEYSCRSAWIQVPPVVALLGVVQGLTIFIRDPYLVISTSEPAAKEESMNPVVTVTGFWDAFITKIGVFLPNLLFSVALIVVGWALCNIIKRIVVRVLRVCQFDTLADRAGIKQALERGGIKQTASDIVGLLVFWFLFLIVIVTTLETLNLSGATDTLHTIYLYIPKIVAALVVLILGLYFANFLDTVVRTSCANAGLEQAASIGRAAYVGTVIFVVAGIFEILDIASEIVIWAFILVFGAVCLALALAFGLGGRDVAGRYLEKWLEPKKNESVEPPS